jgi:D-hydroxyproline dehydrogenase subunit beta
MSEHFDLAVVGGGVLGLGHALAAARLGKRVALIERNPRADGASIRNFGFVTITGQERGDLWGLARRTRELWLDVVAAAGVRVEQRGLYLPVRSPEARVVVEAFLETEMGDGCAWLAPAGFREAMAGWGGPDLLGALHSPWEVRIESRFAIPKVATWLAEAMGVRMFTETAALEVAPPVIRTSRGVIHAEAAVVCPGDDFVSLFPERIAAYGIRKCRLSMLKLADPGVRLPGALMSDLGLTRYKGYAALSAAAPLEARLRAAHPEAYANGVHLIVAQGADGGLIVGDSHHYGALPDPFAPAEAEAEILAEYERATGQAPPPVLERWTGVYASHPDHNYIIDAPDPAVRIVIVTTGAGASTGFGIGERVVGQFFGSDPSS